ncbi:MAG: Gfo/Idh/MocA family protein [Longimicrobiales bacterium]
MTHPAIATDKGARTMTDAAHGSHGGASTGTDAGWAARVSRRNFLRSTAVGLGVAPALFAAPARAWAQGRATLRVGLIGCGGRGTGAARDLARGAEGIELVAMGDLVQDRITRSQTELAEAIPESFKVDAGHVFSGFDAYLRVLETDIDLVILATPPGFRPVHLAAAVESGKHVFTEKPVAVDPVGIRSVLATAELAKQKSLALVAGTQRRHDPRYIEVMRRIHDGAIGEITSGQVYWNQAGLWNFERTAGISDTEWQIRNWLYFTWLSGDHIVEQHIHNIDVANWAFNGHPVRANGVGGRQSRVDPSYGHIFDHFAIELEYANGARILSMARQQDGTARYVGERFAGTQGTASPSDRNPWIRSATDWRWEQEGEPINPYVQEHTDLVASIRNGSPLNEGNQVAESTLTAILAREAAYTGQDITWDEIMASNLDLTPPSIAFGPMPFPPVAQPGLTKLERPAFGHSHEPMGGGI